MCGGGGGGGRGEGAIKHLSSVTVISKNILV